MISWGCLFYDFRPMALAQIYQEKRRIQRAMVYGVGGWSKSFAANSIWSSKWFSAVGGSVFCRANGIPQFAEVHFVDQMAFRSLRKCILPSKWHSAVCGSVFCRANGVPQFAEVHFVEQMAFRSWRKYIFKCKWHSAVGGSAFPSVNGIPQLAEVHFQL
jgi:hypothetical protein